MSHMPQPYHLVKSSTPGVVPAAKLPQIPFAGSCLSVATVICLIQWGMYGRIVDTDALDRFGDHGSHPVPCLSSALASWFKAQIGVRIVPLW